MFHHFPYSNGHIWGYPIIFCQPASAAMPVATSCCFPIWLGKEAPVQGPWKRELILSDMCINKSTMIAMICDFVCVCTTTQLCAYIACIFIYLSIYLFIYLSIYLFIYLFIYLCIYLFMYLFIYLFICYLLMKLFIYQTVMWLENKGQWWSTMSFSMDFPEVFSLSVAPSHPSSRRLHSESTPWNKPGDVFGASSHDS